jgi:hypothetical protein
VKEFSSFFVSFWIFDSRDYNTGKSLCLQLCICTSIRNLGAFLAVNRQKPGYPLQFLGFTGGKACGISAPIPRAKMVTVTFFAQFVKANSFN